MARSYTTEPHDELPFGTAEKARRYATERYLGAIGLNWYALRPDAAVPDAPPPGAEDLAWAEPHLDRVGALMGGPIAERAELTDKQPARGSSATTGGATTSARS